MSLNKAGTHWLVGRNDGSRAFELTKLLSFSWWLQIKLYLQQQAEALQLNYIDLLIAGVPYSFIFEEFSRGSYYLLQRPSSDKFIWSSKRLWYHCSLKSTKKKNKKTKHTHTKQNKKNYKYCNAATNTRNGETKSAQYQLLWKEHGLFWVSFGATRTMKIYVWNHLDTEKWKTCCAGQRTLNSRHHTDH